jgi:hypothetical protein
LSGILLDGSGLHRAGKRAALLTRQEGRCGCCGRELPAGPHADHDHDTGLLRGMLCPSCNMREGRFSSAVYGDTDDPGIAAYLAAPPAAGLGWMWDLPSWWGPADTREVTALGITAHEYVTTRSADRGNRRKHIDDNEVIAALQAVDLPPLG